MHILKGLLYIIYSQQSDKKYYMSGNSNNVNKRSSKYSYRCIGKTIRGKYYKTVYMFQVQSKMDTRH